MTILTWLKKRSTKKKRYPTSLNRRRWDIISPLLPDAKPGGRPRTISLRQVLNAILYVTRGGGAWRLLPLDFPAWETVYGYFRDWTRDGTWHRIHETLYLNSRYG